MYKKSRYSLENKKSEMLSKNMVSDTFSNLPILIKIINNETRTYSTSKHMIQN